MQRVHGVWHTFRRWGVVVVLTTVSGVLGLPGMPQGPGSAQAAKLEGQHFEDTLVLGERTLRLNGLGLRGVAWIKAFVAGIYLSSPTREAAQVLSMPGPKRLRLKVMLDAPSHELTKSLLNGVRHNETEAARTQLSSRVESLATMIDGLDQVHPGDTLDLDFIPNSGLSLRHNGKQVGQVLPGEDLYRAVLKIFVGERPVDKRMREGLLRGGV